MIIAIDGPAGAGKSTIAKKLAKSLGVEYIDSGAIYRAFTYYGMKNYYDVENHINQIVDDFRQNPDLIKIVWENHLQKIFLNDADLSQIIRLPEVTNNIKYIASHNECRDLVNQKIRNLAEKYSFVIDGRDIGSIVFPNAKYKFYLDASIDERTMRRAKEMNIQPEDIAFAKLYRDIEKRDQEDMEREIAPLIKSKDAHYIDSSDLSIEEVILVMTKIINN